jgi:hypothetical protein
VESQCAILLCEGSAQKVVIDFAEEHGRDPLKAELFALLEQQLLGPISGDRLREVVRITLPRGLQFESYCARETSKFRCRVSENLAHYIVMTWPVY